jgi:hypothetical protein
VSNQCLHVLVVTHSKQTLSSSLSQRCILHVCGVMLGASFSRTPLNQCETLEQMSCTLRACSDLLSAHIVQSSPESALTNAGAHALKCPHVPCYFATDFCHCRRFEASEAKVLRVSISTFCDIAALVSRTMLEFDDSAEASEGRLEPMMDS